MIDECPMYVQQRLCGYTGRDAFVMSAQLLLRVRMCNPRARHLYFRIRS